MPDVIVEEQTCGACGAGVRPDTQFCYNCGESLEGEDVNGKASVQVSAEIADAAPKPILIPNISSKDSTPDLSGRNGDVTGQPLPSAATLRRKSRTMERKPVEVVWEPAGNGANVILIVATILLVLFSVVVVGLALYYR